MKIANLGSRVSNKLASKYDYQGDYAESDDETGLDEFYLRQYDPQQGQWLQPDPYKQFASPYVGMGNNPINMVDPSGGFGESLFSGFSMFDAAITGAGVGFLAGGIAAAVTGHGDDFWKWGAIGAGAGMGVGVFGGLIQSNWSNIIINGNFFQKFEIKAHMTYASIFSPSAREMIRDLKKRPHKITIEYGHKKYTDGASTYWQDLAAAGKKGTVWMNVEPKDRPVTGNGRGSGNSITLAQNPKKRPIDIKGNLSGSKTISLLHELFHAWEASYGKLDFTEIDGVRNMERNAVNWENIFRIELRLTPRKYYENIVNKNIDLYHEDFRERAWKTKPSGN